MKSTKKSVPTGAADKPRLLEQILFLYNSMSYADYLKTPHWQIVRERALLRSNNKCQLCASTERLEAHHNTYVRRGHESPEDVIVLCHKCHSRHHQIGVCTAEAIAKIAGIDRPVECVLPKNHEDQHQHSNGLYWDRANGKLTFYKAAGD